MIDINWNNFKAKFNERETKAFERLAYLLFCSEFGIKVGIFRFKNQTGIETEPIKVNKETIGFQAKFYDTKIADNKDDIIDSIEKAKRENAALTKIILYTNQEISESNKKGVKKPQYLVDIENAAKKIRVKLEWRVPSHFDVQLALPANEQIAEYFFTLGKNVIDFITEIKSHTENILHAIQSDIELNGSKIKIDRSPLIESLNKVENQVAIIAGEGGSGKTAMIKDIFENDQKPLYVFKAAEFNVSHIADLFKKFGEYNLSDFISAHEGDDEKVMVVDSAEKLADLENQDAFKEFLSGLLRDKWKIFFTTRYSYLDDLTFQLLEVYRLHFDVIRVENLKPEDLRETAKTYNFLLPENEKLLKLIANLFYLNEFISQYQSFDTKTDLAKFKTVLWQKKIQNSSYKKDNTHLEREKVFLQLAKIRCETGHFYINSDHLSGNILALLSKDEIVKYEESQAGYFITHDIYEEWALDRIIDREYNSLLSYESFFDKIGTSLPIRRAFRHWLSEKLTDAIDSIKPFIESVFTTATIPSFWKDELLISVLLSDYSQDFFIVFEKLLLSDNKAHLKKIIFLLRTACKELDKMLYQDSTVLNEVTFDSTYLITQPKGKGWENCIAFIYQHVSEVQLTELPLILALMEEWTSFSKKGNATKNAALFALHFYNKRKSDTETYYHDKLEEKLLSVFLSGTSEIKEELTGLIDELMKSDLKDRHRTNDDLLESILTVENNGINFISEMPEVALRLAYRFWYQPIEDRHPMDYGGLGVEQYYSIPSRWHHDYFPASAYQTPILYALRSSPIPTLRFIVDFTNRAVDAYVKSGFDDSVKEIDVQIDNETITKQFISGSLWNIFRGTGSPVSPYLLQSYHMALEKYLLGVCKWVDEKVIGQWLLYLLKNTRSASITAVVASVVLAFQDKFFDIALILFRNYDFLQHDNGRLLGENQAASIYRIGAGLTAKNKLHESDRLGSINDPHRKKCLEHLALEYQFFRNAEVTDEEAERRLNMIHAVLDEHYEKCDAIDINEDNSNSYRLLLARIDRRRMNPKVEMQDDKFIIEFNPEIDSDLKQHSEEAIKESLTLTQYASLKLWGVSKFEKDREYGPYPQYDDNPVHAIHEVRTLVDKLNIPGDHTFQLFNHAAPAFACYALMKDHSKALSSEDLLFSRNVLISYATAHLTQQYDYQISDGVEVSINALPFLYEVYPDDRDNYDMILLLTLFDKYPIGEYKRVCDYAIEAINNNLYITAPERAIRLFQGYLAFAEKFKAVEHSILSIARRNMKRYSRPEVVEKFTTDYETELEAFLANSLSFDGLNIAGLTVEILESTFNLVPTDTKNQVHLDFVKIALPILCEKLLNEDDRDEEPEKIDYKIRHRFFDRAAQFLLQRENTTVHEWIKPFVDSFNISSESADFLQSLISAEDKLHSYEPFWIIWDNFYETIKTITVAGRYRHVNALIHNYLLAWPYWKKTAKDWFSLKAREKMFFSKVCDEMGSHPAVLYGIAKFLNEIGSNFLNEGVIWISDMLTKNPKLQFEEQETNTIYYLEILVRKYVYLNRTRIKTDRYAKAKILTVLEFLINNASVNAYLLREDIL